jgi:micrococcal nuclease
MNLTVTVVQQFKPLLYALFFMLIYNQVSVLVFPFLLSIYQPPIICAAVDGDTLRCPELGRVRLLGIDAPEMAGHCRKGRVCAPGNPEKSKAHLAKLIRSGVEIMPVTRDRYGRTVAQVYAGDRNVACEQLRAEMAVYKPKWDNGGRLARDCGGASGGSRQRE